MLFGRATHEIFFFFFGHGKQRVNLSSSTRDQTHAPCRGKPRILTFASPGKCQHIPFDTVKPYAKESVYAFPESRPFGSSWWERVMRRAVRDPADSPPLHPPGPSPGCPAAVPMASPQPDSRAHQSALPLPPLQKEVLRFWLARSVSQPQRHLWLLETSPPPW